MFVTVASFKGGVGKTTTALHLAAYLNTLAPTLLIDGDSNRSALKWSRRGSIPFKVVDEVQGPKYAKRPEYTHIVIDTPARPANEDIKELADGTDLLVIPTSPDALALDAVTDTIDLLRELPNARYRLLLTMVPPLPQRDGDEARTYLETEHQLPVFKNAIRYLKAFKKAALDGVPVDRVKDPRSHLGWDDYVRAGREILK
jgi:chromosome partitioning protein